MSDERKLTAWRLRRATPNPDPRSHPVVEWEAGTVFFLDDRREEYLSDMVSTDSTWSCRKASDLPPVGNIYLKQGARFNLIGSYNLELDRWPKRDQWSQEITRGWNDIYRSLEREYENLGEFFEVASSDPTDLLILLYEQGKVSMKDLREAQQLLDDIMESDCDDVIGDHEQRRKEIRLALEAKSSVT